MNAFVQNNPKSPTLLIKTAKNPYKTLSNFTRLGVGTGSAGESIKAVGTLVYPNGHLPRIRYMILRKHNPLCIFFKIS